MKVISFIGLSGSGKTTLLERLLPGLRGRGLAVGAVKHSEHSHPLHKKGSDSARLEKAGASPVLFAPGGEQGRFWSEPLTPTQLEELLADHELVLIEGWKDGPYPKIEVWRREVGPPLALGRSDVVALVSDDLPPPELEELPRFAFAWVGALERFLFERMARREAPPGVIAEGSDDRTPPSARGRPGFSIQDRGLGGSVTRRSVRRFRGGLLGLASPDALGVEEPLEIRVAGDPVAVTLRTPGDDGRLALGFLFAEGLIQSIDDVGTVAHCGRPGEEGYGNTLEVIPASGARLEAERLQGARRGTLTTAACGACGRRTVDDLLARCGRLPPGPHLDVELIARAADALQRSQRAFALTGSLHAAAAIGADGTVLASFEDVGRHNAVDKVVGALLESRRAPAPPAAATADREAPAVLVVSGRVSFEIVQKAAVARIPVVATVSAPSSLAVDLAERAGITLVGFVRDGGFNVYTAPERLA